MIHGIGVNQIQNMLPSAWHTFANLIAGTALQLLQKCAQSGKTCVLPRPNANSLSVSRRECPGGDGVPWWLFSSVEVQASAGRHLYALVVSLSHRPEFTNRFQIRASALIFSCGDPFCRGATASPTVTIKMNHVWMEFTEWIHASSVTELM